MDESWTSVDPYAPRPSLRAGLDAARRLRFHHRPVLGAACSALVEELRATHVNGGALLVSFDVEDDADSRWFASRNRFDELGFFAALLRSTELREAAPTLCEGVADPLPEATFEDVFAGPYLVDGWLAGVLVAGGAYERFRGSPREARDMARAAVDEVVEGRYEDFVVYLTSDRWSPWFFDVAWDTTGVAIDLANKRVTLLAITDTD